MKNQVLRDAITRAQTIIADYYKPKAPSMQPLSAEDTFYAQLFTAGAALADLRNIFSEANVLAAMSPRADDLIEVKTGKATIDPNVEKVRSMLLDRSMLGIQKYGTTTRGANLTGTQWLQHLQEELCDAAVYVEALKNAQQPDVENQKDLRDQLENYRMYNEKLAKDNRELRARLQAVSNAMRSK